MSDLKQEVTVSDEVVIMGYSGKHDKKSIPIII